MSCAFAAVVAMVTVGQVKEREIPFTGNETSLVRIKANPDDYVGKIVVLCGSLRISDYYNYTYNIVTASHYSLDFQEIEKASFRLGHDHAYLYLSRKIGGPIVDRLTKFQEEKGTGGVTFLPVRVKAALNPKIFPKDRQWNMMEVLDAQFITPDYRGWQPWIVEQQEAGIQAELTQRTLAEIAKVEEARKAKLPQPRTWTDTSGIRINATYRGMVSGIVRLQLDDGHIVERAIDDLSADDRDYIKQRRNR